MRTKILLFLFITGFLSKTGLQAQVNIYSFAASAGTYTPITGGTNIFGSGFDDNPPVSVPLGFSFTFNNVSYTSCFVNANGYITFGTASTQNSYVPISVTTGYAGAVSAYGRDLNAQSTAPLGSVDYVSTAGVFTVQWSNTRRYVTTATTERFEMQIQLVQATNQIKIVYGTWTDAVLSSTVYGQIGLRGATNSDYLALSVASGGSWAAPTLGTSNAATVFYDVASTTTKPTSGLTYTFNVPAPCTTPATPTSLTLNGGFSGINGSFTAPTPAANYYLIVQTSGAVLNTTPVNGTSYAVGTTLGNGTVVSAGNTTSFAATGLISGTAYTYTIFAYNSLCSGGPLYQTASPLTGTVTTASTIGFYTWTGATSKNYQVASNWSPARSAIDPTDILQFSDGVTDSIQNIPTQTIGRIYVVNGTNAVFQSAAAATLTIVSDNNPGTPELYVDAGATLKLNSNFALGIVFTGTGGIAFVSGTLEVNTVTGTNNLNTVNFTDAIATIDVGGTLAAGGTAGTNAVFTSTAANLTVNGIYNHKYTTVNGSGIPTATWSDGSVCLISGTTTAAGGPNGGATTQSFWDFVYNCPGQTSASQWSAEFPGTVRDTLKVISTGTGEWQWSTTQAFARTVANYLQAGGTVNTSTSTGVKTLNVTGGFRQTGGLLKSTGTAAFTINFNGTAGTQNVNFHDSAATGPFVYQISNPINLTGTGALTSAFKINTTGGVRISTINAAPITTSLALTYAATGTTLTYDATGSYAATASVFPATNAPFNLTVAIGAGNVFTLPFSRSIGGTTTLTTGDVDLTTNTYTVGSSATSAGTLTANSNFFRITTGSLSRWYGTTGLPTTVGSAAGSYPVLINSTNRAASVYFSTATALSTGGTIAVSHTNATGTTTGLSVNDGGYVITTRTNAYWTVTAGNGLATSGTVAMQLNATNLFSSANINNVRLMKASSIVGTHVPGSGTYPAVVVARSGLTAADLTGNFYAGAATPDINTTFYTAIATGNWSTPSVWDLGSVPPSGAFAFINNGVTVSTNGANAIGTLLINTGGTLNINTNSLTVGDVITNNGTLNVGGGTLTIGPAGGGSRSLINNGSVVVSAGTLTLNGNLNNTASSFFTQSGGAIVVDGNAGGVEATSVASGTAIVSFKSQNLALLGGTFTIVDPHASATASNTFEYVNGIAAFAGPSYTFIFGDGVSNDAGGNSTNAFRLSAGTTRFSFSNVTVNGSTGSNRFITQAVTTGVTGNLLINPNAEWRTTLGLYVGGNLTNNGILTNTSTLFFANFTSGIQSPAAAAQTVSGTGIFRNAATSPTANFVGITHQNAAGVTYNIGDFKFSGTVTFSAAAGVPSKAIIPTGKIIEIANAGTSGTGAIGGWVVGTYQKAAGTGGIAHTYPVGSLTAYTPLGISGNGTAVTTSGSIAVSTTSSDHPNISTSGINAAKSINRYWNVQLVDGITLASGLITVTPNWVAADVDAGVITANLKGAYYNGNAWTITANGTPTATSITLNGLGPNIAGDYQVGEPGGTVPITLLNFTGEHKQDRNQLTWTTASEQNNKGFELQRSADGTNFSAITFVASKAVNGNSSTNIMYSFADIKAFAGNNYYRLKQIDNDGKISYSNIVLLKGDKVAALTLSMVYPNPAKDKLNVIIASPKADKLTLIVSDVTGKIVRQQKVNAVTGDNNFVVNVQSLIAGNYIIKAICNDGCETVISRFVKQ